MPRKIISPTLGKYAYGDSRFTVLEDYNLIKKSELNSRHPGLDTHSLISHQLSKSILNLY